MGISASSVRQACGGGNPNNQTTNRKPKKQIFILSGQSNMSGRGGIVFDHHTHHKHWDGIIPPECSPHPSILRLSADLCWEEARVPLHADIDAKKACGIGPGMPFANALRERVGLKRDDFLVGLVPCAVGGTAIREWARGEKLYESMVTRSKAALVTEVAEEGGDCDCEAEIKAVLWYQGESDTVNRDDAVSYKEKMETLICHLREDLGMPYLPIIQVAITSGTEKYIPIVREAQLGINLPNVACVDAKGLKLREDNLHLVTESQVKLGRMLAEAYLGRFDKDARSAPCLIKFKRMIPTLIASACGCTLVVYLLVSSMRRS